MRPPPPVQIACGEGGVWALLRGGAAIAAAAAAAAWLAGRLAWPVAPAAGTAAGLAALYSWLRRPAAPAPRVLAWDGSAWSLDGRHGRPQVMVDIGGFLLLRFHAIDPPRSRWVSVDARAAGAGLHLWRAALYSSVAQPTPTSR